MPRHWPPHTVQRNLRHPVFMPQGCGGVFGWGDQFCEPEGGSAPG